MIPDEHDHPMLYDEESADPLDYWLVSVATPEEQQSAHRFQLVRSVEGNPNGIRRAEVIAHCEADARVRVPCGAECGCRKGYGGYFLRCVWTDSTLVTCERLSEAPAEYLGKSWTWEGAEAT